MGGGGFMLDMLIKSEENRKLRKAARQKKLEINRLPNVVFGKNNSIKIEKKEISAEELEKIRTEFLQNEKKHRTKQIISIILTVLLAAIFIFTIYFIDKIS